MKKQILNLGRALNKTEQKGINGGGPLSSGNCGVYPPYPFPQNGDSGHVNIVCSTNADCPPNPIQGAPYMCDFGCCLYAY